MIHLKNPRKSFSILSAGETDYSKIILSDLLPTQFNIVVLSLGTFTGTRFYNVYTLKPKLVLMWLVLMLKSAQMVHGALH